MNKQTLQEMQELQALVPSLFELVKNVLVALLIFFVGRLLINWLRKIVRRALDRSSADKGLEQFVDSILKFVLYALLIFTIATRFGVDTASVAAIIASCGVAIGLALQGSLSNFASGVMIMVLKPFAVGDYIIASDVEGTVKEIQMFCTKLATVDNRSVVVPNSLLTGNVVTNVTGLNERQLEVAVSVSYESDLKRAKAVLARLIEKEERIDHSKEVKIFVSELGDNGVTICFRAWLPVPEYWPVKWEMLEKIKLTFDEEGIVIPYPQVQVHTK